MNLSESHAPSDRSLAASQSRPQLAWDPRTHAPRELYLSLPTSDVCNYRCRHCHIWLQEVRPRLLTRARRLEVLEEFAVLSGGGTVILSGGEVTLDFEELLAVAARCRDLGLPLIALSNGSRIDDPSIADAIVASGVTHLAISLDSHLPALHNYTRNVATAFADTTRAIRLVAEANGRRGGGVHLIVAAVLFKENLPLFGEFVEFCRSLGAQSVDFQLLARTFANRHPTRDPFFAKHFWHTLEEKAQASEAITRLLCRFEADPTVVKKPVDLQWILPYIADPDYRTARPICGSHYHSLFVDAEGNAALCFNTRAILGRPFVGNVAETSLGELWTGTKAGEDREQMDRCRLNCGALNCHRRPEGERESDAFAPVGGSA